jgi:hypothetical protein
MLIFRLLIIFEIKNYRINNFEAFSLIAITNYAESNLQNPLKSVCFKDKCALKEKLKGRCKAADRAFLRK